MWIILASGRALTINVIESGHNYQASPAPTVVLPTYILCTGVTGTFTAGETVTGAAATSGTVTSTVVSFDTDTQVLKLSGANGTYGTDITITSSGGATATAKKLEQGTATVDVASVVTTDGAFLNEDGWVSEDTMKVQDSLKFQDYSSHCNSCLNAAGIFSKNEKSANESFFFVEKCKDLINLRYLR